MKIHKLTEEEINELPFPDIARGLGGILVPDDYTLSNEQVKVIKKLWHDQTEGVDPTSFKTPIVINIKSWYPAFIVGLMTKYAIWKAK